MKEEQNHQKESEQLNFLNGTTKEIANKKEKDLGEKKFFQIKRRTVEIFKERTFT